MRTTVLCSNGIDTTGTGTNRYLYRPVPSNPIPHIVGVNAIMNDTVPVDRYRYALDSLDDSLTD